MPVPVSVTQMQTYCPGLTSRCGRDVGVVELRVAGLDGELAAVRHGVAGVDREVEQRVLKLVGVAQRRPQAAGQHDSSSTVSPTVRRNSSSIEATVRSR